MKVDGACFCGQITYEAELDTDRILICNCTDCQTLSGSAFRTVAFTKEDAFTLITGELKIYIKIADSGQSPPAVILRELRLAHLCDLGPGRTLLTASVSAPSNSATNWFRGCTSTTARSSTGLDQIPSLPAIEQIALGKTLCGTSLAHFRCAVG